MVYSVLVESTPDGAYVATALGMPDCFCTGGTEEAAIQGVQDALTDRLSRSKMVQVHVGTTEDSWAKWVGHFASDPTWEDFQELMASDRKTLGEESPHA